ncbi:jac1p [Saccharomyces arboricola H-6]|uniref:Jac1p n=1 Tax=Saccharomyces arboricola (strain H-6 / AS 2.3317 / CBS 10644) TaxID=1160507 RepID=J8PNM1_SACAR|nr:jac1p [Saccharomyces arboricola H-6]
MLRYSIQRRFVSTFYELFPKTFPKKLPIWTIDQSKLRKEYRQLQAQHHPDMSQQGSEQSSTLNQAYHTLKDPLRRSQYMLKLLRKIDLTQEQASHEVTQSDPQLLLKVLDIHDELSQMHSEAGVKQLAQENKQRVQDIEARLEQCYKNKDYATAVKLTVELKYWYNLTKAFKDWVPGEPLELNY